ncbi:hypothetical protein ACFOY5_16890 [Massilia aurea]|uniref:hypothetical protein n=1 Tax=Massilia aurea TaxID=373040 RepID=UPI002162C5B9|nr:hypothetical protein [Massilia aurea]MCS0706435.1 hypothetical protein [Massilia aurea]
MLSIFYGGWSWFQHFLTQNSATLHNLAEFVKVVGSFASFYAVYRLSRIEKRYVFKATVPLISKDIEKSLTLLNKGMADSESFNPTISEAVHKLHADAMSLRRKVNGDSKASVEELLISIRTTGLGRRFWHRANKNPYAKSDLLNIYGKGQGLLRSLKNDLGDMKWSNK